MIILNKQVCHDGQWQITFKTHNSTYGNTPIVSVFFNTETEADLFIVLLNKATFTHVG